MPDDTYDPPCPPDLSQDEVKILQVNWCKAEYEQPVCRKDCYGDGCECLSEEHTNMIYEWELSSTTFKEIRLVTHECRNWVDAQKYCCEKYDGKLWEPTTTVEWNTAWNVFSSQVSSHQDYITLARS